MYRDRPPLDARPPAGGEGPTAPVPRAVAERVCEVWRVPWRGGCRGEKGAVARRVLDARLGVIGAIGTRGHRNRGGACGRIGERGVVCGGDVCAHNASEGCGVWVRTD